MAREGLMDDCGYRGFEECSSWESCNKEAYRQGIEDCIRVVEECVWKDAEMLVGLLKEME